MSDSDIKSILLSPTFQFPEDIVIEILLRLPVKSLIRFTVACKSWYALIKTRNFISMHLEQSTRNSNHNSYTLVHTCNTATKINSMLGCCDVGVIEKPIIVDDLFSKFGNYWIDGVSNGLVCISLSDFKFSFVVCNPLTRQYNYGIQNWDLLNYKIRRQECIIGNNILNGFNFDPNSGDYKIISLVSYYDKAGKGMREKAGVYTMSTDSWREINIQVPVSCHGERSASALIKGVLYWRLYCVDNSSSDVTGILSFDMSNESFKVIAIPSDNGHLITSWNLTQVKEQLATFVFTKDRGFDIWTLNHDSMSWSMRFKVGSLPLIAVPKFAMEVGVLRIVGRGKNNDVIYEDRTSYDVKLFLYDIESRKIKVLHFGQIGLSYQVNQYTESLVPVKKGGQIKWSL